ncbi:MAG: glutathione S-transferase family protein [Candidatus Eremiobacterota bacterium]
MKLYYFPFSPNSTQCLAVAYHLGLDLDLQVVDLRAGEQRQPWFVAINPNHFLPTLVDGDFTLWESNAILQYLARGSELWPADERTRIDIDRWLFWKVAQWYPCIHVLQVEHMLKGGQPPDAETVKQAEVDFRQWAGVLEGHLKERRFLVGDALTLADLSVAAPLAIAEPARLPWGEFPALRAWYHRVADLPAWQKSLPEAWRTVKA